jgi:hypothetical protein
MWATPNVLLTSLRASSLFMDTVYQKTTEK